MQPRRIKDIIKTDLYANRYIIRIKISTILQLLFQLHNSSYFRNIFYYRIGPKYALLISWYRPGCKTFSIPYLTKIGKGLSVSHPFATILNAESIGDNFTCKNCTTIGQKQPDQRPVIGDNVYVGCNAVIIGKVHIGNNVMIGAGTVVVKDIPNNAVVVGNPAHIVKYIN